MGDTEILNLQTQTNKTINPNDLAAYGHCESYSKTHNIEIDPIDTSPADAENNRTINLQNQAKKIWEEGRGFEYIFHSCRLEHVGDVIPIECLILSYAATKIKNCEGIHISISGTTGRGKSHITDVVINHLPTVASQNKRVSDKAMFYHEFSNNSIVVMDDQHISEDMQEAIKNSTTNWDKPYTYATVKNQTPIELHMPTRTVYWIIKVNLNGDEQILDRQIILHIDESEEQLQHVQDKIKDQFLPPVPNTNTHNTSNYDYDPESATEISKLIWDNVPCSINVYVPFSKDIKISLYLDARTIKIFYGLIQTLALLHSPIRKKTSDGAILASYSDFEEATRILNPLLENKGGSQTDKLSSSATIVLEYLKKQPSGTYKFSELMVALDKSDKWLSDAINGRKDVETEGIKNIRGIIVQSSNYQLSSESTYKRTTCKEIVWNKEQYYRNSKQIGIIEMDTDKRDHWKRDEREYLSSIMMQK